jgi:chaperonin GroES
MNRITSLKPLLNRCLVKKIVPEAKTKSGIILTTKSTERDARFGQVVAVGPGDRTDDGKIIPVSIKVGDYVLLPEYQGARVKMQDDAEYYIYKDTEILGVVEGVKH